MPKVVELKTGYNSQVVEHLEDLLKRAKGGEVVSITSIFEVSGGVVEHAWTGTNDLFTLLGYASRLMYVLQKRIDNNEI